MTILTNRRRAMIGGALATTIAILGTLWVNVSTKSEAQLLLQSLLPATRFFSSAVMSASATILALMLTLLTFSLNKGIEFRDQLYADIRDIARTGAAILIAATVLLLLQSIPIAEQAEEVPAMLYRASYYGIFFTASFIGGGLVMIVLLLQAAIQDFINLANPEIESNLIVKTQEQKSLKASAKTS